MSTRWASYYSNGLIGMLDRNHKQWLKELLGAGIRFDEPMSRHTSFRIGGPADALAEPADEFQLKALMQWARQQKIPCLILGGGTNVLIRDAGIRGLVIRLGRLATDLTWRQDVRQVHITAGVGLPTKRLCSLALRHAWQGMNFALGIPGTLGGAIMMNAGTSQGCMADVISAVTLLNAFGQKVRLRSEQLKGSYRKMHFSGQDGTDDKGPVILLQAELNLTFGDRNHMRRQAQDIMKGRVRRQPSWLPSAGCFFKNPAADMPAGRLIEAVGLKGMQIGDAQVSSRHANFIINCGNAKAVDVLALADLVQNRVQKRFGVRLRSEVRIVGQETSA